MYSAVSDSCLTSESDVVKKAKVQWMMEYANLRSPLDFLGRCARRIYGCEGLWKRCEGSRLLHDLKGRTQEERLFSF